MVMCIQLLSWQEQKHERDELITKTERKRLLYGMDSLPIIISIRSCLPATNHLLRLSHKHSLLGTGSPLPRSATPTVGHWVRVRVRVVVRVRRTVGVADRNRLLTQPAKPVFVNV